MITVFAFLAGVAAGGALVWLLKGKIQTEIVALHAKADQIITAVKK